MRRTPHSACSRSSMNSATVWDIQRLLAPPSRIGAGGDRLGGHPPGEHAGAEEGALERALAVQAPAAEAGRLACGVEAGDGLPLARLRRARTARGARSPQHAAAQIGLDAAQAL